MTQDELLRLADRCEAATGPDRALDRKITRLVIERILKKHGEAKAEEIAKNMAEARLDEDLDAYTASLDAAMLLVPEGWETAIYLGGEKTNVQMETEAMRHAADFNPIDGLAATPALALTAAALRAIAKDQANAD